MDLQTDLSNQPETAVPINKTVFNAFAKAANIFYARNDNGSLYVSNGQYIQKVSQSDYDDLIEQSNKRRRTDSERITTVEKPEILSYVGNGRGKFELTGEPLDFEISGNAFVSLFADDKQYFGYDKKYVDIFNRGDNRLFVDDNTGYDFMSHCMIVKSHADEIVGVVLPLKLGDAIYEELADVLPLKIKWKNELERIKANPTNDPYIGKEYFDGRETHIIAEIKTISGDEMYIVPRIENGKLSGGADYVRVDEIENQIERWETKRIDLADEAAKQEMQARADAAKKAEYDDARGFTDNMTPIRKGNVLKVLNGSYNTKDYGNLSVKQFIGKVVEEGRHFEARKFLKKQYCGMDANSYLRESVSRTERSEVWAKYKAAEGNKESADGTDALWLKSKHPFLYYLAFNDKSVLPDSFFDRDYSVKMDGGSLYVISKTAYDYGRYLKENPGAKSAPTVEKEAPSPPTQEEDKPPARQFTHVRQSPWGEVQASEKLCPGVYMVSAEKSGGVMVTRDMTAALSPAALKCGVKYNDFVCFEENGAKEVALRELLDKKLWSAPGNAKEKSAFEEKINSTLREQHPQYWRSRENRGVKTPPAIPAPDRNDR